MKYRNPQNLIFQHLALKEEITNSYKSNRLEDINRKRNDIIIATLTSFDFVEIGNCGGNVLDVFEDFFCHNVEYFPYTEFVINMFEKRDFFKSQGKDLLQNLAKKSDSQCMVVLLENDQTRNINVLLRLG